MGPKNRQNISKNNGIRSRNRRNQPRQPRGSTNSNRLYQSSSENELNNHHSENFNYEYSQNIQQSFQRQNFNFSIDQGRQPLRTRFSINYVENQASQNGNYENMHRPHFTHFANYENMQHPDFTNYQNYENMQRPNFTHYSNYENMQRSFGRQIQNNYNNPQPLMPQNYTILGNNYQPPSENNLQPQLTQNVIYPNNIQPQPSIDANNQYLPVPYLGRYLRVVRNPEFDQTSNMNILNDSGIQIIQNGMRSENLSDLPILGPNRIGYLLVPSTNLDDHERQGSRNVNQLMNQNVVYNSNRMYNETQQNSSANIYNISNHQHERSPRGEYFSINNELSERNITDNGNNNVYGRVPHRIICDYLYRILNESPPITINQNHNNANGILNGNESNNQYSELTEIENQSNNLQSQINGNENNEHHLQMSSENNHNGLGLSSTVNGANENNDDIEMINCVNFLKSLESTSTLNSSSSDLNESMNG